MLSCTVSCTRQKRFLRFLVDGKEPGGPSRTSGVRTWGDASPPILVGSVCRGGTQGSLGTFVFTGAVQPSTHCTVDFPPPRCIRRKLLSADGSSLFIPPRALDWEESRGGNKPKQEGIKLLPPLCSCPPPVPLNWKKKSSAGHFQPGCAWRGSERQENQPWLSSLDSTMGLQHGVSKADRTSAWGFAKVGDSSYQAARCAA